MSNPLEPFFFSPLNVPGNNLQVWLDAADVNGNGSQPVIGANVSSWVDKSGNGRNFSQVNAGNQPIFTTYLSNPAVRFTGSSSQSLSNNYVQTGTGARNTYLVFADISTTANVYGNPVMFYMAEGSAPGAGVDWRTGFNGANEYLSIDIRSGAKTMRTTPNVTSMRTQPTLALWGAAASANVSEAFVFGNGTQFTTSVASVNLTTNINTLNTPPTRVGGGQTGYATFALYELLHFDTNLTTLQRQQIEGYLAWKWGVQASLPSTHPFRFDRPLQNTISRQIFVFSPLSIPGGNLQLWLDGADVNGTGVQPAEGAAVTTWTDKSGAGNNASGGVSPTFSNNGVVFNGSTQYLTTNYSASLQSESVFIVANQTVAPTAGVGRTMIASSANGGRQLFTWVAQFQVNKQAVNAGPIGGSITQNQTRLFEYTCTSGSPNNSINLLLDGTSVVTGSLATYTASLTSWIGRWPGSTTEGWVGPIYEILGFNAVLDPRQREQIEGYLAWKWGLQTSLPSNHPFRFYRTLANDPFPTQIPPMPLRVYSAQWLPTNVPSCAIWFDAADTSTITEIGGTISEWRSKGTTASVATTTLRGAPSYNSLEKGVDFTSTNAFNITNAGNVARNIGFVSMFLVGTMRTVGTGGTSGNAIFFYFATNSSTAVRTSFTVAVSGLIKVLQLSLRLVDGGASGGGIGTQDIPTNQRMLIEMESDYSNSRVNFYINGVLGGSVTNNLASGVTSNTASASVTMGNRPSSGYLNYDGFMNEVLIYNAAYTSLQREQIEGYLAWKWGIQGSLPANHPFKFFPPPPP